MACHDDDEAARDPIGRARIERPTLLRGRSFHIINIISIVSIGISISIEGIIRVDRR
jgi:hypothetical protein